MTERKPDQTTIRDALKEFGRLDGISESRSRQRRRPIAAQPGSATARGERPWQTIRRMATSVC